MSKFLTLSERDLIKGFIVTVFGVIFTGTGVLLSNGGVIDTNAIKLIILGGLGAGFSYLGQKLFTNTQDIFGTKEPEVL